MRVWRDLRLPALFATVGAAETLVQGYKPAWASIATLTLGSAVLAYRRSYPLLMPSAVMGAWLLAVLLGVPANDAAAWLPPLVLAAFSVGMYCGRAVAAEAAAVLAPMAVLLAIGSLMDEFTLDVIWGGLFTLGPWLAGRALRTSLERNRELAAETERVRFEAERAATAERERIARELHDILAHSLSVMIVQASVAEDLLSGDTNAARDALHEVQQSGRDALSETARLLRLIRDDNDEIGMQPQHQLADVAELAVELNRMGMEVDVELDASTSSLPLGVQVSAYRIVQEALTNALKHAPGSPVSVRLARRGVDVEIEVRNGPATRVRLTDVPSGQGLAGVRERVSLFGGTLRTEPTDDGGFLVAATLPGPAQ